MTQLRMGGALPTPSKLEKAFWKFHDRHPEIYHYLLRFACEWLERRGPGCELGIATIYERVRWEVGISTTGELPKLSNNHRAFYSRLLMVRTPRLRGMFKLREQEEPCTFWP